MDVNTILTHLVQRDLCFPAMKLAWNSQLEFPDLMELPKISPSHYIREIELSTEERHSLLCQQQKKLEFWKPGFEFTVTPSIVVFQKYKAGDVLHVTLSIRNISKGLQKVQILMDETDVFSLEYKSTRIAKFASGMTISATIKFTPEDDKDYLHKIVIGTKNTSFSIPVIGIGARAVLDLPDNIFVGSVPVKYLTHKTLSICNIGSKYAKFSLSTEGPFSVSPEKGVVALNDSFLLRISYFSDIEEKSEGFLCVKFDNGEEIFAKLEASSIIDEQISIIPSDMELNLPDTYFGLKSNEKITILNRTNCVVHFTWKKFGHGYDVNSDSGSSGINLMENIRKSFASDDAGISSFDLRRRRETFQTEQILAPEPLFDDPLFVLEPLTGDIQPQSSTEIHVVFSPKEHGHFKAVAYCDITGHEDRLQMKFYGQGLGPKFRFGFDSLDIGDVYLGGSHTYEIPVTNTSNIKGTIVFDRITGLMPKITMKVEPKKIKLVPGAFSAFYANFNCTGNPSEFLEEMQFRTMLTDEAYAVTIKGIATFPRLHFSVPILEFGQISYGFPCVEEVTLFNDTLNTVDIHLRIDEDGVESALSYEDIIASFEDQTIVTPMNPKEFTIEPTAFQLEAKGFQKISIKLVSNNYGEYKRKLLVYIGSEPSNDEPVHDLPIFADCNAPMLMNAKPDFTLDNLYVGFAYSDEFHIVNSSNIPGIYCIVAKESPKTLLTSDNFIGILNPKTLTKIPFKITCTGNKESVAHAELYLTGKTDKIMDLDITCTAIYCKLETNVESIDFGPLDVLTYTKQSFEVINDSPLTIPFKTVLVKGGNVGDDWILTPEFGVLEAHGRFTIEIDVRLRESGYHTGVVRVQMLEIEAKDAYADVKVSAIGVGTSLEITQPNKMTTRDISIVDFGTVFTKCEKVISFDITNLCFYEKILEWRRIDEDPPDNSKQKKGAAALRLAREKEEGLAGGKKKDKKKKFNFRVDPIKILLQPNESVTFNTRTYSEVAKDVQEEFNLWSYTPQNLDRNVTHLNKLSVRSVGLGVLHVWHQAYKPAVARNVLFQASFEVPKLTFSKKNLVFQIFASPYDDNFDQKLTVRIENHCSVPLPSIFQTEFPFQMLVKTHPRSSSLKITTSTEGNLLNAEEEEEEGEVIENEEVISNPEQITKVDLKNPVNPVEEQISRVDSNNIEGDKNTVAVYDWTYTFQPKSAIYLTINFDGQNVRRDKGNVEFESKLNIFFEGHPDSETIPLKGEVHFPSVECSKSGIDFGVIPNGSEAVDTFTLKNECNFTLKYKWYIRPHTTFIRRRLPKKNSACVSGSDNKIVNQQLPIELKESSTSLANGAGDARNGACDEKSPYKKEAYDENGMFSILRAGPAYIHNASVAREPADINQSSDEDEKRNFQPVDEYGNSKSMTHLDGFSDSIQFVRDKLHRNKLMEIVGLRNNPANEQFLDDVQYLQTYNPYKEPTPLKNHEESIHGRHNMNITEIIDVTPLCGTIGAGQSLRFTVVFYGHSDIQFRTILSCQLEGGQLKNLPIAGASRKVADGKIKYSTYAFGKFGFGLTKEIQPSQSADSLMTNPKTPEPKQLLSSSETESKKSRSKPRHSSKSKPKDGLKKRTKKKIRIGAQEAKVN